MFVLLYLNPKVSNSKAPFKYFLIMVQIGFQFFLFGFGFGSDFGFS